MRGSYNSGLVKHHGDKAIDEALINYIRFYLLEQFLVPQDKQEDCPRHPSLQWRDG